EKTKLAEELHKEVKDAAANIKEQKQKDHPDTAQKIIEEIEKESKRTQDDKSKSQNKTAGEMEGKEASQLKSEQKQGALHSLEKKAVEREDSTTTVVEQHEDNLHPTTEKTYEMEVHPSQKDVELEEETVD